MSKPAATALDVCAAIAGEVDEARAQEILASYFEPGPKPRYDTPALQAEAEAGS